ncbi:hypothetical protein [Pseudoalteromonas luteoviolacea]|uniref:Uncharacterized protein n=1 Tax=Pseudoalteromonas luteoviolacea DSM 6061 TaxID=1365250 RepID=A0A166WHY3_9GAMM|nr:hypothetical protein [Pseudoalteromonas luteoviolacea]KZN37504.1 hypothetical protein N475_01425 [Pseudoalteromonas luteoviolacea DSM 6061]KZN49530.1 hypothetical protein N474_04510 [Pseudoalteromonas luteoviolacea CPMOR-2]MBE0387083.1 hypothetical protein [Pseudoalteromonas luteoviolacea DSM 6061]TQF71935.1 hypothetical protein FLM44_12970 [Pseudoalteromonas luteoviolacea]
MLLHKTNATSHTSHHSETSKSSNSESGEKFSNELIKQSAKSDLSRSLQNKDLSSTRLHNDFLSRAKQTVMFNRLGVNEEKIKEIEAKMQELIEKLESGKIDKENFDEQMEMLESMMAKELKAMEDTNKKAKNWSTLY